MDIPWSPVQLRRLQELEAGGELSSRFLSAGERDVAFQELEGALVKARRAELAALQKEARPPSAAWSSGSPARWPKRASRGSSLRRS